MTDFDIIQSFKSHIGGYFASKTEYSQVHALLIAWAENDIYPEQEISDLREVFEQDFKYEVSTFKIPGDGTQGFRLNKEISSFVETKSRTSDSLIIIYYAGHCEPDSRGRAQWAAREEGGPVLSWHIPQQLLFSALGDVLLLLDCCDASLVTDGSKDAGRFELLAASAKGSKTPIPGKHSFTRVLIKELKKFAVNGIYADELASIMREDGRITETPVFHDFARQTRTKVRLQRMQSHNTQLPGFMRKPAGYMLFRASLSDDVTGRDIADWLKTAPPQTVTSVNIEAVVTRARRLQQLCEEHTFPDNSIFHKLSGPAKKELLCQLRGLNTLMSSTELFARDPARQYDRAMIEQTVENMQQAVNTLCTAVETPLLIDFDDAISDSGLQDELVTATDAGVAILLREAVLSGDETPKGQELSKTMITITKTTPRFKLGTIEGRSVIIETHTYVENPADGKPYQETLLQAIKMTALLSHPKRTGFHILPCVGFYPNQLSQEIGLVFEAPVETDVDSDIPTLLSLYKSHRLVSLGERIRLACALVTAVEHFHRVGWVHKSIRSDNIAFGRASTMAPIKAEDSELLTGLTHESTPMSRKTAMPFDLGRPFLFGFEYARPGDAGTNLEEDYSLRHNLYRHPDRWGRPSARFEKAHDIFALGVVLLEIALWRDIESFIRPIEQKRGRVTAMQIRNMMTERCREHLPHQVGDIFSQCILTCLEFGSRTQELSEYESQRYFQIFVATELGKVVGRI